MSSNVATRERPPGLIVGVLFLAIAAFQVAATMIFPALPTIGTDLGASAGDLSLSQSLFFAIGGLTSASLPLSDRFGRKKLLLVVISLGIVGSLVVAFASTFPLYNLGRWLQAPGVIALPLAFLILRNHVSSDRYPIYLGWLSALNLGATGVDGAVAGWITDTVGYQGIFWIAAAAGGLALAGVASVVPRDTVVRAGRIDWLGLLSLGGGVVLTSVGLAQAGGLGWTSPVTLGLILGGVVLLVGFVVIERASNKPLVEVRHLRSRNVLSVPLVVFFGMAGFLSVFSFLAPFWLQLPAELGGGGLTATVYALATLPGTILSFVLAPICGTVARKFGWRPILAIGAFVSLVALIGMTLTLQSIVANLFFFALLSTVFAGATMTAANGLGVLLSPHESPAFLPGIVSVMFSFGASFGAAVVGTFVAQPSLGGFTAAFATAAGMMLVAYGFTFLVPRGIREEAPDAEATKVGREAGGAA